MNFNDVKYSVIDWIKERRYASGPVPLIIICVILGVCLIWIGSFFIGGDSYSNTPPVLSARDVEAKRINEQLHVNERLIHVWAGPAPDDENAIVISGEVHTRADRAALENAVKQITSTYSVSIGEILIMSGQ